MKWIGKLLIVAMAPVLSTRGTGRDGGHGLDFTALAPRNGP